MVTVQDWLAARVAAAGGGAEEGPLAGDAADGDGGGTGVGEGEGFGRGLAGGDLVEVEQVAGEEASGDVERGGTCAVAFDVADAVEGWGAVGGGGLGE